MPLTKKTPQKSPRKTESKIPTKMKTPTKPEKTPTKNEKTAIKTEKEKKEKTPIKATLNKADKTAIKDGKIIKKDKTSPSVSNNVQSNKSKTPEKEEKAQSSQARKKTEGGSHFPLARIRMIMKTTRDAESVSPDAVSLVSVAAEWFLKDLVNGTLKDIPPPRKKITYKDLANYVNKDSNEDLLYFLQELIPPKITVAEYKKLIANRPDNDMLLPGSSSSSEEESDDGSEEGEEEEEDGEEEEDEVQEIKQSLTSEADSFKKSNVSTKKSVTPQKKKVQSQSSPILVNLSDDEDSNEVVTL